MASTAPRHRARELVLQALYAAAADTENPKGTLNSIVKEEQLTDKNTQFANDLFSLVKENQGWANGEISKLSKNWTLKRIAEIDRIILRMAMVEIQFMPDIPVKVALDEAIELAKSFSTPQSAGFVNGILDSFARNKKQADAKPPEGA